MRRGEARRGTPRRYKDRGGNNDGRQAGWEGMRICGEGRGNLRENREDPAPTVGIGGEAVARYAVATKPSEGRLNDAEEGGRECVWGEHAKE